MNNLVEKIAIGTVQFGLNYGINNTNGIPSEADIDNLLRFIFDEGIDTLDTAYNYGNSEIRIGRFLQKSGKPFKVISKAPKNSKISTIEKYFLESLERLTIPHLYGFLLHDFIDYENDKRILAPLYELKNNGKVDKVGFSLYHPEQLEMLFNDKVQFDIVQIPYNLADRRFEKYLGELKKRNIEIHVRSVFLQGLFFMNPETIPEKLIPFKSFLILLDEQSKSFNKSIASIALNFVLHNMLIDKVVLGVDNVDQMKKNILDVDTNLSENDLRQIISELEKIRIPEKLLMPSNWN